MNVHPLGGKIIKSSQKKNQRVTLYEQALNKKSEKRAKELLKEVKNASVARAQALSEQIKVKRLEIEK